MEEADTKVPTVLEGRPTVESSVATVLAENSETKEEGAAKYCSF